MSLRLTLLASLLSATATTAAMAQVAGPGAAPRPAPTDGARTPPPLPYGAAARLPPGGPGGSGGPGLPGGPGAGLPDVQVNGTVVQWLLNPNGDADGLLLSDGTQVVFPPHVGEAVGQTLKVGDAVQVGGWRAPEVPVLRMQTLSANGRSVTDQPPTPAAGPRPRPAEGALRELAAGGRVDRLLYNDRGDVHGALMSDRTIVRFPPHIGAGLLPQLQPGTQLSARGWGTRGPLGTALEATSLGLGGGELRALDTPPAPRRPL